MLRAMFQRKSDPLIIDTPEKLAAAIGAGYETVAGQSVTTGRAMQLSTVFGCVRVLAESVGMLPCSLFKESGRNRSPTRGQPGLLTENGKNRGGSLVQQFPVTG